MSMHENSDHTLRHLHVHEHTHTCSMTHKYIVLLHIGRKCWHMVHISHLEDFKDSAGESTCTELDSHLNTYTLLDTQTSNF